MGEVLNELNSEERDFFIETTVAQVVVRYNLLAVPVLDDTAGLVGIVTIDDVVDVHPRRKHRRCAEDGWDRGR